jgi:hypothetical protein
MTSVWDGISLHSNTGSLVEYPGSRWRVQRVLGVEAVLLRSDAGDEVSVDPLKVQLPEAKVPGFPEGRRHRGPARSAGGMLAPGPIAARRSRRPSAGSAGSGSEGVGGPLRMGYLQRRLAGETNGEVVVETLGSEGEGAHLRAQRTTSLTEMRARISAWRDCHGLPSDLPFSENRPKIDNQ